MTQTEAVKQFAIMKLCQICEDNKNKEIPNWFVIEGMMGFNVRVTEGDLNFLIGVTVYPVDEEGPGHYLARLQASFISPPVKRQGYEFLPAPIGSSIQIDQAIYAADEKELQNGILQWIHLGSENILCQILE